MSGDSSIQAAIVTFLIALGCLQPKSSQDGIGERPKPAAPVTRALRQLADKAAGTDKVLNRATRRILRAVARVADRHESRPPVMLDGKPVELQLHDDALSELYVRTAAQAALAEPESVRARALLLAMAISLDHDDTLKKQPLTAGFVERVDPPSRREPRRAVIGEPTLLGRRDLLQHFVVSGALTALAGAGVAETIGIAKESHDAQFGTGFSFVDLSADLAGIAFASRVLDGRLPLNRVAESFRVADYVPDPEGLKEGVSPEELERQYGGTKGKAFADVVDEIRRRIAALAIRDNGTGVRDSGTGDRGNGTADRHKGAARRHKGAAHPGKGTAECNNNGNKPSPDEIDDSSSTTGGSTRTGGDDDSSTAGQGPIGCITMTRARLRPWSVRALVVCSTLT